MRLLLQKGWKYSSEPALKTYQHGHTELSLLDGCVLWGTQVVPPPGRDRILCQLHEGHPGISRMKTLARSFVWWPGLDKALEDKVKACEHCQHSQHLPAMAPIQPWEWPERPWSRLHVDYAGPLRGEHMFLVVVDAYSKWMEVRPVKSATSARPLVAGWYGAEVLCRIPLRHINSSNSELVKADSLSETNSSGMP